MAVPLFLLGLIIELLVNYGKNAGYYRSNDAINSISAGILSKSFEYFTRFIPLFAWGYALENFSLIDMDFSTAVSELTCITSIESLRLFVILDKLELNYGALYTTPDGTFPNHHPDPSKNISLPNLLLIL